jgi:hypothetical protein
VVMPGSVKYPSPVTDDSARERRAVKGKPQSTRQNRGCVRLPFRDLYRHGGGDCVQIVYSSWADKDLVDMTCSCHFLN